MAMRHNPEHENTTLKMQKMGKMKTDNEQAETRCLSNSHATHCELIPAFRYLGSFILSEERRVWSLCPPPMNNKISWNMLANVHHLLAIVLFKNHVFFPIQFHQTFPLNYYERDQIDFINPDEKCMA